MVIWWLRVPIVRREGGYTSSILWVLRHQIASDANDSVMLIVLTVKGSAIPDKLLLLTLNQLPIFALQGNPCRLLIIKKIKAAFYDTFSRVTDCYYGRLLCADQTAKQRHCSRTRSVAD